MEFISSITEAANAQDLDVLLMTAEQGNGRIERAARSAMVDGLIAMEICLDDERILLLAGLAKPLCSSACLTRPGACRMSAWTKRGPAGPARSTCSASGTPRSGCSTRSFRHIPHDLSVVANCPDELARHQPVALTHVPLPSAELGRLAVRLLVSRIRGERVESVLLAPELRVAASTAQFTPPLSTLR